MSRLSGAVRRLGPLGWVGLALIGVAVAVAVAGPLLAPFSGTERVGPPFQRPNSVNWLGTDDVGRDLWSQLLLGARPSVVVGFSVAIIAITIGATVGAYAAVSGRRTDAALMRSADVVLTLPFLPVVVIAAAFLGPGMGVRVLVISLLTWAGTARIVRVSVLSAMQRPHVEVALAAGASRRWLLARHSSFIVGPLLVPLFVRAAAAAIVLDASLNFLGLGDPTQPSWGTMLYWANVRGAFLTDAWQWWAMPPGLALLMVTAGLALVGIAVEEQINPALAATR